MSYARDVQPIFQRCVICHHGGINEPNLVKPFDPEHGLINRPNTYFEAHDSPFELLVKPGSPEESFLIYKVSSDPDPAAFDYEKNGQPMPFEIPRVTADELTAIKQWIADGAKNDAFFSDKVAPIFGTAVTLGSRRGKCTLCHYPDSPTGLDILAVFDDEKGLVGAKSLLSTKLRVSPGAADESFLIEKIEQTKPSAGAPMPLVFERLSESQVDTLRRWIEQGAEES